MCVPCRCTGVCELSGQLVALEDGGGNDVLCMGGEVSIVNLETVLLH